MQIDVKVRKGLYGQASQLIDDLHRQQKIDSVLLRGGKVVWIGTKDDRLPVFFDSEGEPKPTRLEKKATDRFINKIMKERPF